MYTASSVLLVIRSSIVWCSEAIQHALGNQQFRFSLLVHCDQTAPTLEFTAASSTLQASNL